MKTLTVEMPDALFEEISRDAAAQNVTTEEIIRERLSRLSVSPTEEPSEVSLWDRMKDLVIESDDLPTDLSTRKPHLDGYGRNGAD